MRIITIIDGKEYGLVNGGYAHSKTDWAKFSSAHRKVIRETKVILDTIANQNYIP